MRPDKKELLFAVFVSALVLSNILAAKIITVNRLNISGGILCYCITFLISDIIGELYGKDEAKKAVVCGFICQLVCLVLIGITLYLPAANEKTGEAFDRVLKNNVWFTVASLAAYIISQTLDVKIFHSIKAKSNKRKWLRNNLSTFISQAADTVIYITAAFGIGLKITDFGILFQLIISQYIVKAVLALIDTPFFYLLTRRGKQK